MKPGILLFSAISLGWLAMPPSHAAAPKAGAAFAHASPQRSLMRGGVRLVRAWQHGSLATGFPEAAPRRPGAVGGPTIHGAVINGTHLTHKR
jgi:hypothetical protein